MSEGKYIYPPVEIYLYMSKGPFDSLNIYIQYGLRNLGFKNTNEDGLFLAPEIFISVTIFDVTVFDVTICEIAKEIPFKILTVILYTKHCNLLFWVFLVPPVFFSIFQKICNMEFSQKKFGTLRLIFEPQIFFLPPDFSNFTKILEFSKKKV